MFWREHSYLAFSTTCVGYLTLRRKSAYLRRKKYHAPDLSAMLFLMLIEASLDSFWWNTPSARFL